MGLALVRRHAATAGSHRPRRPGRGRAGQHPGRPAGRRERRHVGVQRRRGPDPPRPRAPGLPGGRRPGPGAPAARRDRLGAGGGGRGVVAGVRARQLRGRRPGPGSGEPARCRNSRRRQRGFVGAVHRPDGCRPGPAVPDGHLPGPRWRPVAWAAAAAMVVVPVVIALAPGELRRRPGPRDDEPDRARARRDPAVRAAGGLPPARTAVDPRVRPRSRRSVPPVLGGRAPAAEVAHVRRRARRAPLRGDHGRHPGRGPDLTGPAARRGHCAADPVAGGVRAPPGGDRHRDAAVPALRRRRRHQPHPGLRGADRAPWARPTSGRCCCCGSSSAR